MPVGHSYQFLGNSWTNFAIVKSSNKILRSKEMQICGKLMCNLKVVSLSVKTALFISFLISPVMSVEGLCHEHLFVHYWKFHTTFSYILTSDLMVFSIMWLNLEICTMYSKNVQLPALTEYWYKMCSWPINFKQGMACAMRIRERMLLSGSPSYV